MSNSEERDASSTSPSVPVGAVDPVVATNWRQSKWLAIAELVVVALIFVADFKHLIPFSKTPFLFVFAWLSLWARKFQWRDVGFALFRGWKATIVTGIGVGLMLEAFQLFVSQPILVKILHKQPDLELFRALTGNWKMSLLFLARVDRSRVRRGDGVPRLFDESNG